MSDSKMLGAMWLLCSFLLRLSCAMPFEDVLKDVESRYFDTQLARCNQSRYRILFNRVPICAQSPFFANFPFLDEFFAPMDTSLKRLHWLSTFQMRPRIVKVYSRNESNSGWKNFKEIMEEGEEEGENKTPFDNADAQVNGEKVERESFMEKYNNIKSKESEDVNGKTDGQMFQVFEKSNENDALKRPELESEDENISISSNLV